MNNFSLKVENLNCQYGDRVILHNVNFSINAGTVLGLQGRNGCGKSTLMATMAGIIPYCDGTITVGNNHYESVDIAWLGTQTPFYPQLTVHKNLSLWTTMNDYDVHEIDIILGHYQLTNLVKNLVRELSRGQLQRLALCRLHLTSAKIWLLDEPLTGLDTIGFDLFAQNIQRFKNHGGIVIMAPDNEALQDTVLNVEDYCP